MSMTKRGISQRRGLSLIELLVVIAILAILVGLVIAAVQRARHVAQVAGCFNNLRQVGVAFHSYHNVKGRLPTEGTSAASSAANPSLYKALLPYVEQRNAPDSRPIAVFLCPGRRDTSAGPKRDFGYASSQANGSVGPSVLDSDRG